MGKGGRFDRRIFLTQVDGRLGAVAGAVEPGTKEPSAAVVDGVRQPV